MTKTVRQWTAGNTINGMENTGATILRNHKKIRTHDMTDTAVITGSNTAPRMILTLRHGEKLKNGWIMRSF